MLATLYGWGSIIPISLPARVFIIEDPLLKNLGWQVVVASVLLPYLCRSDLRGPAALWLNPLPIRTVCVFAVVLLLVDLALEERLLSVAVGRSDGGFGDVRDDFLAEGAFLSFACFSFLAAISAPVTEELIFRGMLYSYLRTRLGPIAVILITGILFALGHYDTVFRTISFCIVGLLYGLAREATGGVTVPIAAHVVHNIFVAICRL